MRLVVPPHFPGQIPLLPTPSLLKAVARARQWYEWVIAGNVWGGRSIAQEAGFSERHVSQILECAFLAPDIVEAILDGRQPADLMWRKLTRNVSMDWVEQRKRLGFARRDADIN
jgi:site-specific DNA recombinase